MIGEAHATTGFLYEIGLLKRYPRTGWALAGVRVAESVAATGWLVAVRCDAGSAASPADDRVSAISPVPSVVSGVHRHTLSA
jgi:putative hydrolases of HD superfamily